MEKTQQLFARLYIGYMCIAFCLFYQNNYINIMQAKRIAFLWGTGMYIVAAMVIHVVEIMRKRSKKYTCNYVSKNAGKLSLVCGALFAGSWMISLAISLDKSEAFWGYQAKCTGLLVYLSGAIAIFFLSRYLTWTPILTWLFLFGTGSVCLLQTLNRWKIDPLGMYSNLVAEEHDIFISTIGQVNYNAAFDCLVIAVLMVLLLLSKERFSQTIYSIALVNAFCGAICCCSDSAYLVILVLFFSLFVYVCRHPDKWIRFCSILVLFDVSVFLIWLIWCYIKPTLFWGTSALLFNMKLHWLLTGAMWLVMLIGVLFFTKLKKYRVLFEIGTIAAVPVAGIAIFTSSIEKWQVASEIGWAGSRAKIWSKCFDVFQESSVLHKLWGYGFNNIHQALEAVGDNQLGTIGIYDAHNVFLNSLLTSGMVGTVLGVAFLVYLLVSSIRSVKDKEIALIGCVIVVAYITQGMLNGPQILTEPVYLVAFGVAASIVKKSA